MEFECGSMTSFGCERMDGVKELIMAEIEEAIEEIKEQDEARRPELIAMIQQEKMCTNACCYGCEKSNLCVYTCNRVDWPDEERKINYKDEELRQEKLLGIKCYNCAKEINQEGHKANIRSDVTDCVWLCDDCFKRACGDQSKFEDLAKKLKEKFKRENKKVCGNCKNFESDDGIHGYCVTDEDRANNYKNWNNELRFFDGNEGCADFKKIEDLREEFEKEEIKQVDYEQLTFF